MAKRPPFQLRRLILCYNIMMVLLNIRYLVFVIDFTEYGVGLFRLRPYRRDDVSAETMRNIELAHGLFMTKFVDLFDTVFFVLRKKQEHVSLLHLYHHSAVPILFYIAFRLLPIFVPLAIFALINCSIHVLMYSYYALASFGPNMQPYLWWKKYITQIQMMQFVIYALYIIYCSIVIDGIPFFLLVFVHVQSPIFLILFGHFYIKAYIKNRNNEQKNKRYTEECNGSLKNDNEVVENGNGVVKNGKGLHKNGNGVLKNGKGVQKEPYGNGVLNA